MLSQDRCCPATEADAGRISASGQRQIELLRFSRAGKSGASTDAWAASGWQVISVVFHDGSDEATPG